MRRIYTQLLVWMVIVSLFAATPIGCISALTVSPETALSNRDTHSATAPLGEHNTLASTAEHRTDHLPYFQAKTEEELYENLQHAKQFALFVDSLPGLQSVAARQLLHSVNRNQLAASNVSRPLRL